MQNAKHIAMSALILTMLAATSACLVEPRNDYYDRDHHRYYHEHAWRDCGERDDHCR